ncbi:MAG TPA: RNA-binding protein [Elusimicrobiota bacterium]|jgi:RNA recognition motif-containing protein|nr:RNA-binding protein [Elusimicrobiota bacterium]
MPPETSKLFVGGLPAETTYADLVKLFCTVGPVFGAKIVMDRKTGLSKGFAFVEMSTAAGAEDALKKLDGHKLADRRIFITWARPQEKANGRPAPAPKPAAFVDRRSGKDRRSSPSPAAPRRKSEAPAVETKPGAKPAGFGPGFTRDRWKKPGRVRRSRPA